MASSKLSLLSIIKYADITVNSRNLVEAERLLDSNFVITFGATKVTKDEILILALCLKTSGMKEAPHTINGSLLKKNGNFEIGNFQCSCKAGAAVCKHKTAVLLLCNRNDLNQIPLLSSTDVKCIWDSQKNTVKETYMPVPISDFCHVKMDQNEDIVPVQNPEDILKRFIEVCPNSALAVNLRKRKKGDNQGEDQSDLVNSPKRLQSVEDDARFIRNIFLQNVPFSQSEADMPLDQKAFYEEHVKVDFEKAFQISREEQRSETWKKERKIRITASRCYELFTYARNKNPNWPKKIKSYLSDFPGNTATEYGLEKEDIAINTFAKHHNVRILKTGLLVHPEIPWLGHSPDGLFVLNDTRYLIEVKCPILGLSTSAVDLVKMLSYVEVKDGAYTLKQKHNYYGQIQCGMLITGITHCYFIIFSSYDNSYVSIIVERNEKFIEKLSSVLHDVYFNYFLPYIFESYN